MADIGTIATAATITAGLFTNLTYDLVKNGGAMMLPTLRQKLKGWVFKDETAEQLVELSEMLPPEARTSQAAFQAFIESKNVWQQQLKEIRQESTEYRGSNHVEGNARDVYSANEGDMIIRHNHYYGGSSQSEQHQAANKTGSPTVKKS